MASKHRGMFKAWYGDNILSHWTKKKVGENKYVYEKKKHVRATDMDRLGKEWEHEFIWNN